MSKNARRDGAVERPWDAAAARSGHGRLRHRDRARVRRTGVFEVLSVVAGQALRGLAVKTTASDAVRRSCARQTLPPRKHRDVQ
jgi:hypothetical protein